MNLPMDLRGGLARLPSVLEAIVARINTLWNKQHKLDGSHAKVTALKVTTPYLDVGDYRGRYDAFRGFPLIGNEDVDPLNIQTPYTSLLSQGTTYVVGDHGVKVEGSDITLTAGDSKITLNGSTVVVTPPLTPAGGGAPAPHAPTHNSSGTDPVDILNLGGFPGGSATFLRADRAWSAPPPLTMPANVAYTNVANTFTQNQTIQAAEITVGGTQGYAKVRLIDLTQPANARRWEITNYAQNLRFDAADDAGGVQAVVSITRAGHVAAPTMATGAFNCTWTEASQHLRAATGVYAGTYFYGVTGAGYLFDALTSRGMLRAASGILSIANDNQIDLAIGGIAYLSIRNVSPFGWANTMSHTIPMSDNTTWLGYNTGTTPNHRWYGGAFVNTPSIGSDRRDKEILGEEPLGLRFINLLKPVAYRWKVDKVRPERRTKHGFVAQDVLTTLNELGVEFDGIDVPETSEGRFGLAYDELLAPMVKAMQEMSAQIDALTARVAALEGR